MDDKNIFKECIDKPYIKYIWAYGCRHRFMYIEFPNGEIKCYHISKELYEYLRFFGIPTAQSRRHKK